VRRVFGEASNVFQLTYDLFRFRMRRNAVDDTRTDLVDIEHSDKSAKETMYLVSAWGIELRLYWSGRR
jgi:hypothetical protein